MSYLKSYKWLNQLMQSERFEPMLSWGLRMALAGTLPVIWGIATGRLSDAIWITLPAEAVSWVELKGGFTWRFRTLVAGALLAVIFGVLGTVTGDNIWLGMVSMFAVGFLATLLKNIGDRASGLGLCVYFLFIICNAYPAHTWAAVQHRGVLLLIGGAWPVLVGVIASAVVPAQEPFRRQIALIWRAIAELTGAVSKSDTRPGYTATLTAVYAKEKDVRTAIDNSYTFHGEMAHQASKTDNQRYQLVLLRKIAGMVAVNVIAMEDEKAHIPIGKLDKSVRIKAGTLFHALREAISHISIFVVTLRAEEQLLAVSQTNRVKKLAALLRAYPPLPDERAQRAIDRILQLCDRTVRLLENALLRVERMGADAPVFQSYSFIKTLFVLRPQYLVSNLKMVFNFSTQTFRYALRSAIAVTVGLFIYKWFKIDHGYWIPFSVMIIIQPYFGATFKKAADRIVGTLLGGIAGSLLLLVPTGLHVKQSILFITFVLMVYYLRRNYAVAAFVITINLILLFNIEESYNYTLMITRALCTIGGALLAVGAGWALLPTWDKKWLPAHLAGAINANYEYFMATFYSQDRLENWTKYKRDAETKNSNVFDSFNRYLQEPGKQKSVEYYDLITCNVRVTRNINSIHLEQDEKNDMASTAATPARQQRINECFELFSEVEKNLSRLSPGSTFMVKETDGNLHTAFDLNDAQIVLLEKTIIELKTMSQELI